MSGSDVSLTDAAGPGVGLPEQMRLLMGVFDAVPAGLLVLGGDDLRARWTNAAFARMLEPQWRNVNLTQHHAGEFLPRAFENGLIELLRHVAVTGRSHVDPEYVYHGFAAGVRYWNLSLQPLRVDDAPAPCDVLMAVTDVTPQVLARDHLEGLAANAEYSLSQLEAIVSSMSEGLMVGDPLGNLISMNSAALRLHGFTSMEQIRRPLRELATHFELSYPDGRAIAVEDWPLSRALRGEQFSGFEVHVRRIDTGRTFIGSFNGAPVRNAAGRIVLAIATVRDVSRQHQADRERAQLLAREQAARAHAEMSEQRYRDLADAMPQIVWTARPDGYLDYYNRRWYEYTGISKAQTHSPDGWKTVLHPADAEHCLARWHEVVRTAEAYVIECRFRRHDGEYRWHLARALPLRDPQGRIIKWFGTCTDIDDQKRTEEALKQAKETAEAADKAKDQFLAVLSHELRTPLTPVLSGVQSLVTEPGLTEEARQTIEMIRRNVELEAKLIDDLLDLTRIARGKLQLDLDVVDLHEIVKSVVEMCAADCRHKRLSLLVDLRSAQHHVKADAARLHQVLWNLLKNAIKFTPPGGTITVRSTGHREWMKLEVIDTGIGIEPETIPRIFFAFEQADPSIAQRFGGLGLGLAISKSLIDMHGGRLAAASQGINHGTTFTVELLATRQPLLKGPVPVSPPDQQPVEASRRALRILMVDDHEDTSRAIKRLLSRLGYEVMLAHNVQSALELASSEMFDLIISDIGLPDGSGLDLMREICARRPIKGIALSGFGMEEDIRKSQEAGFREHLIKPVNVQKLQAVIQRVVSEQQAAQSGVGER